MTSPPPPSQNNFEVVHISKAAKIYPRPEYIFVLDNVSARVAIKNFPDCKVLSIDRGNTDNVYNIFMTHLTDLEKVYNSLIDEDSKKTFCGYWLGNVSNQLGALVYSKNAHYLIAGFIPKNGAIAIDCGVFDGGTATVFSEMGYKVYGFEMDKKNFQMAKKIADEKDFILENLGLSSSKYEMRYTPSFTGSHVDIAGTEVIQTTTLDAYVRENKIPSVNFIKMDVEGAELEILKGAKTSIARYKPILAISAYHKLDDFWILMNYIKSIRPDYEFAMRQFPRTSEEEPAFFKDGKENFLRNLGLEPHVKTYGECVLFAR